MGNFENYETFERLISIKSKNNVVTNFKTFRKKLCGILLPQKNNKPGTA